MAFTNTGDELVTQKHLRAFFQPGGAGPDNRLLYAGQDMAYLRISGVSNPQLGGADGIFMHDPFRVGQFKSVGVMVKNPELAKYSLVLSEKHNGIPRQYLTVSCQFNVYEMVGKCKDLSDFDNGWSDYVKIYPGGIIVGKDDGDRTDYNSDKNVETKLDIVLSRKIYVAAPLAFQTAALTLTLTVANDVAFGNGVQCSDCGVDNDGTRWLFVATTGGAAAKPIVWYSNDGGATWASSSVAAAANAEALNNIFVVGNRVVAVSKTAGGGSIGGYYYTDLNPITGVPGVWTKVTTGFVTSGGPNDVLAISANEIWFVGDGGYIYKSTDLTAGVSVVSAGGIVTTALNRIDGNTDILVICGASGVVLKSINRGATFATATTAPSGTTLQALSVNSTNIFWVGDSAGAIFYTKNGGETWATKALETNAAITDIMFVTPEVGYYSATTAAPAARLYGTLNAGKSWTRLSPRFNGYPTHGGIARMAFPQAADPTLQANVIALAGVATVLTTGYVVTGSAAVI